jgi:hypothetical protein
MSRLKIVGLLSSCLILAACENDPVGLHQPVFGNAVQQNIAGETVNPAAPVDRSALTMDGVRAALQQQKYVTDKVEKPVDVGTQVGLGGNGGGGGGGGGSGGGSTGTSPGAGVAPGVQ